MEVPPAAGKRQKGKAFWNSRRKLDRGHLARALETKP
jgi:hypothetical protein